MLITHFVIDNIREKALVCILRYCELDRAFHSLHRPDKDCIWPRF